MEQEPSASAWPYIVLGPALALQFLLFQNVAHQTVMIGWPQPGVYAWILAANLAGVAVAVELTRWDRNPTWPILGLLGGILVAIVTVDLSGFPAALIVLIGQVFMAVLLVSIVRASRESAVERSGGSISTWVGVGMIISAGVAVHLLRQLRYRRPDTNGGRASPGCRGDWLGGT